MSKRTFGLQAPPSLDVPGKKRYAMVIDLRRCIGCMACAVADKAEFDVPLGVWRTWVTVRTVGKYPDVKKHFLPRLCNHCDDPPCVRVCPVQATYKNEDGFVLQRYERCIGCKACMVACPFNARHLLPAKRTNPNLPKRVVDKCTFCFHRVSQGLVPACAQTCIGRARIFGDINDPNSEVAKLVAKNPTIVLKPEMGTNPQIYYIMPDRKIISQEAGFLEESVEVREDRKAHREHFTI